MRRRSEKREEKEMRERGKEKREKGVGYCALNSKSRTKDIELLSER